LNREHESVYTRVLVEMASMSSATTDRRLALLGGDPIGIPAKPHYPRFTAKARSDIDDVLREGDTVGLGRAHRWIDAAERAIAEWHGVGHCLTTSSGHASLHAALIGLQVTGGAEVITTPYTWGASTSPILYNNAVPVFADVDPDRGLLDPDSVREAIGPRTEAVLVTHIYGQPADMTALLRVASDHGLALIEDGSQAHGARHRGRRVGGFGDAAGFSCMGGKLLATSEAGYMVTDRDDAYWNAVISCQHAGGTEHAGRADEPGFPSDLRPYTDSLHLTYRLSVLNAILLVHQLAKLDEENANRIQNRAWFVEGIDGVSSVSVPDYPDGDPVYHMVTLNFVAEHAGVSKKTYLAALQAEGVGAFAYVGVPLHRLERLRGGTQAPRTMWLDRLSRSGVDYAALELPGCDAKVERSFEMSWNWIDLDREAMTRLAAAFVKVEEQLDALRAYERSQR
jgi:dTDP-4-amino-4,6-dideoxygalactose transaminase